MRAHILSFAIIVAVAVFSVNGMAMEFDLRAWCGGLRWQILNRSISNHQRVGFVPVKTLEELKQVSSQKPSRRFEKFASDLGLSEAGSEFMVGKYLRPNMLRAYEETLNVYKGMQRLFRIVSVPVTEKMEIVPGTGGSASMEVSDFPLRKLEKLAQILGPIPEAKTGPVIDYLKLNPEGVRWSNGVLVVTERSGSTSGMGATDPGLRHPGLLDLISGKVPGYVATPIGKHDFLDRGSVWGGRYSITKQYGVIGAGRAAYLAAEAELPETILTEGLKVLASVDIADPFLNDWTTLVGAALIRTAFADGERAGSLKNVYDINKDIIDELRQFLFEKGLVNYKPNMSWGYGEWGPKKVLKTAKYFRKDKPYYRPAPTQDGIEVFGHLEASTQPIQVRDDVAVLAYLRNSLSRSYNYDVSDILVTEEGQFRATLLRRK